MYGSVRLGYGGKSQPDKEWNVVANAKATQKAFTAAWPMLITPLDTCGLVQLKGEKYQKVAKSDDPIARAVIENYHLWLAAGNNKAPEKAAASSILFDTVAVYLAFSTDLVTVETLPIRVTDDGYTRMDPNGKSMACAMAWKDLGAFEDLLVKRLTEKP
jgi:inosine-uridine nucleoside N-ribohydrolase